MQEDWLLRLYPDTVMTGLCGKATFGLETKEAMTGCNGSSSVSFILMPSGKLLFTHP